MQGIYNCIPKTKLVFNVYGVAAVLYLQFFLHVILLRMLNVFFFFYISTFRSMCAVSNMAFLVVPWFRVLPTCYSVTIRMILKWFQSPLLLLVSLYHFVFTFHMPYIYIVRSLYFRIFPTSFLTLILLTWRIWWAPTNASKWRMGFSAAFKGLITFLFPEIATSINIHVPFSLHGLLLLLFI